MAPRSRPDVEIAKKVLERLEELYGPIIVSDARLWHFDKTHWAALDDDHLVRFVHLADGTRYPDSAGKMRVVKLNKSRVASIIDAAMRYRGQPDFFRDPPCGINCESGFIRIGDDGTAGLMPHARQWRQRHVVRGRWPSVRDPAVFAGSRLAKYLRDAVAGEADAAEKGEPPRRDSWLHGTWQRNSAPKSEGHRDFFRGRCHRQEHVPQDAAPTA
jgi:hypothetical protein